MKKFEIPNLYRSSIISRLKEFRKNEDPRKKDFSPTGLDFGPVKFLIARHFGFCYGVENAIDIAYRTIEENPGKNIFLLSEMIHNPVVNLDLQSRGIQFILDTHGNQLIDWSGVAGEDVIIIPAFGTTPEIEKLLTEKGNDIKRYNTTCPFVERVWTRANKLGSENYTVIVHGKAVHEETRATFSHAAQNSRALIIRGPEEAGLLSEIILGKIPAGEFYKIFAGKYSDGFNVEKDLTRIGVVNQTTMLAFETQMIADLLRNTMIKKYGVDRIEEHFADTRDTLCYATNDNQTATLDLRNSGADLAFVVGGYNSSNTTHLAELLQDKIPTYFVSGQESIISNEIIRHYDIRNKKIIESKNYLPDKKQTVIAITSGASCPDSVVDEVLDKILSFYPESKSKEEAFNT